ncbi:MAG TPA: flagellar hook-basal body complex protein FliE [Lachnospiraceae bacterium]|nr:flagellar hook-basal body complex protein FliE [uncultured Lachnoclostridium sp.]HAU85660.1 flagellar hook-basal body complex protein FliE [Lachnospiraceae bacterium]
MDITGVKNISAISPKYDYGKQSKIENNNNQTFASFFKSALDNVNETNSYINKANEEEIKFALGQSDSLVDLQNAQLKANISLQYTVAIKNSLVDAYKEIMNLQF